MAALSMSALSTTSAVEMEGRKSKTAAVAAEACCAASSSSSSTACSSSTQRWSKETLKAMETHLSLLQKNRVSTIARLASQSTVVDFSSHLQAPLPFGWEQHLDLRTGRVYYMDWKSCKRSYNDPRKALRRANERINTLVQQAVEGQWELQSSVTQDLATKECMNDIMQPHRDEDEGMEVESKWNPTGHPTECLIHEAMEAESKSTPDGKSARSFNRTMKHSLESKWNPDVGSAHLFNCTTEPRSNEAHHEEHHIARLERNRKLEMLRCHHCFSHIIIHIANPWCPQCAHSLV